MKAFKVYRSSAGSGKTYTLTKEFVKLALVAPAARGGFSPGYYARILAVTFTRDAAAEMKQRVVSALERIKDWAPGQALPLLDDLLAEVPAEYPAYATWAADALRRELVRRAGLVFSTLIHQYSDLSISTIDSFTNRIVQSFTKDLNISFNYEVETEGTALLEEAVQRLLERAGPKRDPQLTAWLTEFARQEAEEERDWNIERSLLAFGQNIFREGTRPLIEQLGNLTKADFRELRDHLTTLRRGFEQFIHERGAAAIQLIGQRGLTADNFYYGNTGIFGFFGRLHKKDLSKILEGDPGYNSYVGKTIGENKWYIDKTSPAAKAAIDAIASELTQLFGQIIDRRDRDLGHYLVAGFVLKNIYRLATIHELEREVRQLMAEKNKVHISEFNHRINQIIENEPVPYIYERMGERYQHLLIDEFQDTSQMQWHNLIPLMANALGYQLANMVVGDAKQSIYRWRGGNAELIVSLPAVPTAQPGSPIAEESQVFRQMYSEHFLGSNYRSLPQVIELNNDFFGFVQQQAAQTYPGLGRYFDQHHQQAHRGAGGHVEWSFLTKDGDPPRQDEYQRLTFARCRALVDQLVAHHGYQLRDVTVLCRYNAGASYLAEQFLAHQYQVISTESLLLTFSPTVSFVIDFLRVLVQPVNHLLKSELLYFLFQHFGLDGQANRYRAETHETIVAASRESSLKQFFVFLKDHFGAALVSRKLQYLSLYETVEELVRVFDLNRAHAEQIYLQRLLDEVAAFGQNQSNDLPDFIEHWDSHKGSISVSTPKTGNAIQVMTIHKAKGLQFPVVVLAFADWATDPKPRSEAWADWDSNELVPKLKTAIVPLTKSLLRTEFAELYQRELEATFIDAINMLYVAMTRPEERLYVLAKGGDKKANDDTVQHWLRTYVAHRQLEPQTDHLGAHVVLCADPGPKVGQAKPSDETEYRVSRFMSTECRDKIRMRRDDTGLGEHKISIEKMYEAQRQGNLMHYAFEKVNTRADIAKAVQRLVFAGLLAPEEQASLAEKMEAITQLPALADLFEQRPGRKILNEKELIVRVGSSEDSRRPDRVVIDPDRLTIVDYKTGAEQQPSHVKQISEYAKFIQQIPAYRHLPVQKLLVYTEVMKVVQA
jgi:ATP-dependent helicase/nuclease subunit A